MATMSRWETLLAVQEHDTTTEQLTHRRATMPERAELEAVMGELAAVDAATAELERQRGDLARSQQRLDDEVAMLRAKSDQSNATLYGGTVTNPRQLEALQEEITSIGRRVTQLEDQELELMEATEPVEAELAELSARRAALDERAIELRAAIAEAESAIDAELAEVRAERDKLASHVDPDLLAEYASLRGRSGIGIARLVGGSCQACHLSLSAIEVDRIKHLDPDVAVHCEECGRLLVR
jgi:uncharacterized protein